jgi:hypothetical protein
MKNGSFKLVELIVVIGVIAVLAMIGLRIMAHRVAISPGAYCVNNLKQVGISFQLWAYDHGGKFPMQVSTNQGGALELADSGDVSPHFVSMSNELQTPKIIYCPGDRKRQAGTDFASVSDVNISYFIVPQTGNETPGLWLAGDRDLSTDGVLLPHGPAQITTNSSVGWAGRIHKADKAGVGIVVFNDGHVEFVPQRRAQESITSAIQAYNLTTTGKTFRLLIP